MDPVYACGALRSIDSNSYQNNHPSADLHYGSVNPDTLPKKIDLRKVFGEKVPVRDQGQDGACVAFASNVVAQQLELQDTSRLKENLAPRFTYLNRENQDSEGMYPHNAMELLQKIGVVRDRLVPWNSKNIKTKEDISPKAYAEGQEHKMGTAARVVTLDGLRKAISERNAGAIITFKVYNFTKEFWKKEHPDQEVQGGHCVAVVGYKDAVLNADGSVKEDGNFIIQNSWGDKWADKGFTYYPYKDFKKGLHDEIWTFVDIKGSKPFNPVIVAPQPHAPAMQRNACAIL